MEGLVLQSLEFRVNTPTCYTFLSLLNQHLKPPPAHAALSVYLLVRPLPSSTPCARSAPAEGPLHKGALMCCATASGCVSPWALPPANAFTGGTPRGWGDTGG